MVIAINKAAVSGRIRTLVILRCSLNNMHNVSATISVRDDEWDELREAMWEHRDLYSGISLLPFDGGTYQQAPFESCDQEVFQRFTNLVNDIDLKQVVEEEDNTNRAEIVACSGNVCEIV